MSSTRNSEQTANVVDTYVAATSQAQAVPKGSALDQDDLNYNIVRDALAAKPAILQAILKKAQQQTDGDITATLHKHEPVKADIGERLSLAETRYQATLNENADRLFELFKKLPIDRKVDLLIQAEAVGEINDKVRTHAREQMQASRIEVIAAHQAEIAYEQTATISPPPAASMVPRTTSPWNFTPRPDHNIKIIQHTLQTLPLCMPDEIAGLGANQPAPTVSPLAREQGLNDMLRVSSPAAVTVNLPFTHIPGLPALSQMLEKIDRTTHLDLGFSFKGFADREANPNGGYDLLYRLSYVGTGVMSSKFNMQLAPIAIKLEDFDTHERWGGNSSILTKGHSDQMGTKFSVNLSKGDVGLNYAPEASYQSPSNRIVSTLTGGRHFGHDGPAVRIPSEYVPAINRIADALPSEEEAAIIVDRINKVVPINQIFEVGITAVEYIAKQVEDEHPSVSAAKHLLQLNLIASSLSSTQQAIVTALIHANTANSVERGVLPTVQINEKHTQEVSDHTLALPER
ncbi:MAG: hypothetical protein ACXW11_05510 [Methylotenera sp.]